MTYRHFNNEATRSSVIRAVADTGNNAAWNRLFDMYAGFIYSIARHKGLSDADADDMVQIVFADLARNLPTFKYDREKGRFRSYLAGLVNWRVMDRLRTGKRDADLKANFGKEMKAKQDAEIKADLWEEDFWWKMKLQGREDDKFYEREWENAKLENALQELKLQVRPEHFAAFYAINIEGQDTEIVMRLYNLSRDNIYQICKRLKGRLREIIEAEGEDMDNPGKVFG